MEIKIIELLVMFLLMIFYWYYRNQFCKKKNFFQYFLILNYLYLFFSIIGKSFFDEGFESVDYLFLNAIYFGFSFYLWRKCIKEEFLNSSDLIQQKKKKLLLISVGIIFLESFSLIIGFHVSIFGIPMGRFLLDVDIIIELISLILVCNKMKGKFIIHFCVLFLITSLAVILDGIFPYVGFASMGGVVGVLYLYLTLENMGIVELEVLRLENEYQKDKAIDKISFLKNISHEIRTPINTIDGFSQMIVDNDDTIEIKKDVSDMRVASRDLIDVINGMIDLSIIESGELKIIDENYNVYDMFDNVVSITNSKLREKSVQLKYEIADDIPQVLFGDSERISQVILNLLKNAIKNTKEGNIYLKISRIKSDTICRLKIEVKDTGKVISREELEKIFSSSISSADGNLNLAVTRYLLQKMNGNLEVDDHYQKGNCFIVTLDQKIISNTQDVVKRKEKKLLPFKASDKKILIVDDNKLNLKVATRLLRDYQVNVVLAGSGEECLNILDDDHDFDLILMDDLMPGMSGTEVMNLIKKIGRVDGYYIPVVALTANAVTGQREKYLESGFDDYLSKPIDRYELDKILRKYLIGNLSK